MKASTTVTRGSTVARIEAFVGPARRRPAKKRLIAATVATRARPASEAHPAALTSAGRNSPMSADPEARVTAAPVHTSAERSRGGTRLAIPSLTSM